MISSEQNTGEQPQNYEDVLLPPLPPREVSFTSGLKIMESINLILPLVLYAIQVFLVICSDRGHMLWHLGTWYLFPAALFAYRYRRSSVTFHAWEDIALSKIGELSPGLVKIEGNTRLLHDLAIPGADTKVALYHSEKYYHSDDHDHLVEATDSADNPFLLVDDTGSVMVDPREAKIGYPEAVEIDAPPEDRKIVVYSVSYIPEGQPLTVVGFARPLTDDEGNEIPGRLVIGQPPNDSMPHTITAESPVKNVYSNLRLALKIHLGLTLVTLLPLYIYFRVWEWLL